MLKWDIHPVHQKPQTMMSDLSVWKMIRLCLLWDVLIESIIYRYVWLKVSVNNLDDGRIFMNQAEG